MVATGDGIAMNAKIYASFQAGLLETEFLTGVLELLNQRTYEVLPLLPTPDTTQFLKALPFALASSYETRMQDNCIRCHEIGIQFMHPLRRDTRHTCGWGPKPIELRPTMKEEVIKEFLHSQKVIAMLMIFRPYGVKTGFDNIIRFKVDKLEAIIRTNETLLWKQVCIIMQQQLRLPVSELAADVDVQAIDNSTVGTTEGDQPARSETPVPIQRADAIMLPPFLY